MSESFIEFYGKHNISPVRQDISNLELHYRRREALYRHLGLLPEFLSGKKILEVGPGSGHNSIHTASLAPSLYHLVDGNPTGVSQLQELFLQRGLWKDNVKIYQTLLEDFESPIKYDIVLCEGMLSGLPQPKEALKKLASFVEENGVLIVTSTDPVSAFAESLRYLLGNLLVWDVTGLDKSVEVLLPIFTEHLSTLKGMSRRHDDWIIDNIINPAAIGSYLSIPESIEVLEQGFTVYGSSPNIFTDWRWYKNTVLDQCSYNEIAIRQYWSCLHSIIDYRNTYPTREIELNKELFELCKRIRENIRLLVEKKDLSFKQVIIEDLSKLRSNVSTFSIDLAKCIDEVLAVVSIVSKLEAKDMLLDSLKPIFGRGQQFLSYTKNCTEKIRS